MADNILEDTRTIRVSAEEALALHSSGRPGKLETRISKPLITARDLSLAYSPGVAEPCLRIAADPALAYDYTTKGNMVAVVSNGTAVLGLGNLGALASKPVMEGKVALFKRFADIDGIDLCLDTEDVDEFVNCVRFLGPSFGGINLEDIKAPECFVIEDRLRELMDIPVFHDDQHGTAIVAAAGLINACHLTGRDLRETRLVVNGAGAAAIACVELLKAMGLHPNNVILCDTKGVVFQGRTAGMNQWKSAHAIPTEARTLHEALLGADAFFGLSIKGALTPDMVAGMADAPIIFAMANPDPEITPEEARRARPNAIIATGRSDYPNQVNNVLGFPFIFRGALDVRATEINEEMKMAATRALALLAKQDVPDAVAALYGLRNVHFGANYLIPFPFDPRVLLWVAPAVAWAAVASGVAREFIDLEGYREQLEGRLGRARGFMRGLINRAMRDPKRIVFPEGEEPKIMRAASILVDDGIAHPILLGNPATIQRIAAEHRISLEGITIDDPATSPRRDDYAHYMWQLRQRKGLSLDEARRQLFNGNYFGSCMVARGDADALLSGVTMHYPETIRPALQVIGAHPSAKLVSGMYMLVTERHVVFCADTTVNIDPTAEQVAQIAFAASRIARTMGIVPRIAMLSFSNFGSVKHPDAEKMARAAQILKERDPSLVVDGEMQADTAFDPEILMRDYPFNTLKEQANVLIFPNLSAGNIAYKLLHHLGGATAIGPILLGMRRPVHVLERGADVQDIVNMAAVAVVDAQERTPSVEPVFAAAGVAPTMYSRL